MAHTYRLVQARTSFSAVVNTNVTIQSGDTVVACLIKVTGGTNRTGGAPTLNGVAMTQANSTQKAASSPECSAELWYILNPGVSGSVAFTLPNTNASAGFYTLTAGQSASGGSALQGSNGANNTSTNPAPGAVTPSAAGDIGFAIVASGAQTWSPTARAGTQIADTDDGAHGGGEQYIITPNTTAVNLGWTFGTSDDWGAVSVFIKQTPNIYTSTPVAKALTFAGQTVSVLRHRSATPQTAALSFAGQTVSVSRVRVATPQAASLTFAGQTPTVLHHRLVTPTAKALSLTGQTVSALRHRLTTPTAGAIALSGQTVTVGRSFLATPQSADISFAGMPVTVTHSGGGVFTTTPQTGTLSFAGQTVTATRTRLASPQAASLVFAAQTVNVRHHRVASPQAASLAISGQAVSVARNRLAEPSAASLIFSPESVTLLHHKYAEPLAAEMLLTGMSVTVTRTVFVQFVPPFHLTVSSGENLLNTSRGEHQLTVSDGENLLNVGE